MTDIATPETADTVAVLQFQYDEMRAKYNAAVEAHSSDIDTIGTALIDEANERGWCKEYDRFVADLNTRLHIELPTRERDFEVTETYTVTISYTVRASDEDDAEDNCDTAGTIRDLHYMSLSFEDVTLDDRTITEE